ncbi:hypothetical protein GOP47_0018330 [Adiantum capillus-veneris]|uniref:Uncharacterized protein n=1 Tax=Adiantum capillus-veneris TaxID=13818 RepID=A0A9D4UHJ7_ADICA|nr:hypothetical protein GOP47_0018330 [Adiantum capillus-veneris]
MVRFDGAWSGFSGVSLEWLRAEGVGSLDQRPSTKSPLLTFSMWFSVDTFQIAEDSSTFQYQLFFRYQDIYFGYLHGTLNGFWQLHVGKLHELPIAFLLSEPLLFAGAWILL